MAPQKGYKGILAVLFGNETPGQWNNMFKNVLNITKIKKYNCIYVLCINPENIEERKNIDLRFVKYLNQLETYIKTNNLDIPVYVEGTSGHGDIIQEINNHTENEYLPIRDVNEGGIIYVDPRDRPKDGNFSAEMMVLYKKSINRLEYNNIFAKIKSLLNMQRPSEELISLSSIPILFLNMEEKKVNL